MDDEIQEIKRDITTIGYAIGIILFIVIIIAIKMEVWKIW
jgi:hypothetical protein